MKILASVPGMGRLPRMRAHLIGVCGVAMAGLARLLREMGWEVTGSDRAAWPPASERLARLGIAVRPFSPANLDPPPDLVVVGNAISRGNPELEAALEADLPLESLPGFLARHVLPGRRRAVVAGTHGKTTTTALLAWILRRAGQMPGMFAGGLPLDFDDGAQLGEAGAPFVLEGDEYDSAFFDKRSKFIHYRPHVLVFLNLEYDHADIFPDLEAVRAQFWQMLRTMPRSGLIVANADDAEVQTTLAREAHARVIGFGREAGDWRWQPLDEAGRCFVITAPTGERVRIAWPLVGAHFCADACAAIAAACEGFGVDFLEAARATGRFRGVARRMSLLGEEGGVRVLEDFAHHPTAIAAVIAAMQARRADERRGGKLWVVLHPASQTMRRRVHEARLPEALAGADRVLIARPATHGIPEGARLRPERVAAALGDKAAVVEDPDEALARLVEGLAPGDDLLVLTNADFGNLGFRLLQALARSRR